jgi:hypothetical protein
MWNKIWQSGRNQGWERNSGMCSMLWSVEQSYKMSSGWNLCKVRLHRLSQKCYPRSEWSLVRWQTGVGNVHIGRDHASTSMNFCALVLPTIQISGDFSDLIRAPVTFGWMQNFSFLSWRFDFSKAFLLCRLSVDYPDIVGADEARQWFGCCVMQTFLR